MFLNIHIIHIRKKKITLGIIYTVVKGKKYKTGYENYKAIFKKQGK